MKFILSLLVLILNLPFAEIQAQTFDNIVVKVGGTDSWLHVSSGRNMYVASPSSAFGYSLAVEPTILHLGEKKNFDFCAEMTYSQKGGSNGVLLSGQYLGGSESFIVKMNYVSLTPNIKWNFCKHFYLKAGPRFDYFTSFYSNPRFYVDTRTRTDFNLANVGVTYAIGLRTGKKRIGFVVELEGQNDFTNSSHIESPHQVYRNNTYILNFGLSVKLGKSES